MSDSKPGVNFYMNIPNTCKYVISGMCFFLSCQTFVFAQTASSKSDSLLTKANHLFNSAEEKEALAVYLSVLETNSDNFTALWRTSFIYAREGFRLQQKEQMMDYYQKSLKYADQTLELYPDSGYSHFVYAMANGRISDLSDSRTRIEKSYIIKEHIERAVELIPEYAPAWHVLGIWHSKVANVGNAARLAAGLLSKGLPKGASNAKAEEYIQKSIQMKPDELSFYVNFGRHYIRAGEKKKARSVLEQVLTMEVKNKNDMESVVLARELLRDI